MFKVNIIKKWDDVIDVIISVIFIVVIFEHILRTVLAFSIVGFEEANIQSFKVNNGDTTTMFQTCSKLKIKKL